jgi:hypothetical protein
VRIWSLHPHYLDRQGLLAVWREALLAQAVLRGRTRGYTRHPQLERFRDHASPKLAINAYLAAVHAEATARGYAFDRSKIGPLRAIEPIPVTFGQLACERQHLLRKLAVRDLLLSEQLQADARPQCHPLFRPHPGPVAPWERAPAAGAAPRAHAPD